MTEDRRQASYRFRVEAAELARSRERPIHTQNGDEQRFAAVNYAMSFTKGLDHDAAHGLVADRADFLAFRTAIDEAFIEPFTARVPGVMDPARAWEAPTAGVVFDLEGPDAQAVTMAPAPAAGSAELDYEMAEVYWLAILRDCPLTVFASPADFFRFNPGFGPGSPLIPHRQRFRQARNYLNTLDFNTNGNEGRPRLPLDNANVTRGTLFRGSSPGVDVGPYLSQFMLIGNVDQTGANAIEDGQITYGPLTIDQRVPVAAPSTAGTFDNDFMTSRADWLAVQNGGDTRDNSTLYPTTDRRFITTPRDLATYVHDDALYQAYLNACLILLAQRAPFDPGFGDLSGMTDFIRVNPGNTDERMARKAGGFALYGGPHILTLVCEVATRALKAVRFQKFNNHLRLRPEALAGRLEYATEIEAAFPAAGTMFSDMLDRIDTAGGTFPSPIALINGATGTNLLPMAFQEGSPMHPAYGAGHATVAGACVTILKAFFDTGSVFVNRPGTGGAPDRQGFFHYQAGDVPLTYVPTLDGLALVEVAGGTGPFLTLEGELNKLAANISIGRNMAGVHFYTDYYDSLRMGEEIAIGMLEEQALGYPTDRFVLSVPTFDGGIRRIGRA